MSFPLVHPLPSHSPKALAAEVQTRGPEGRRHRGMCIHTMCVCVCIYICI